MQALVDAAVKASEGARYCMSWYSCYKAFLLISIIGTKILKCSEGLHNKAFILTMDNGSEVFAKLPNPNAGPTQYTTASEVATHELVRMAI